MVWYKKEAEIASDLDSLFFVLQLTFLLLLWSKLRSNG